MANKKVKKRSLSEGGNIPAKAGESQGPVEHKKQKTEKNALQNGKNSSGPKNKKKIERLQAIRKNRRLARRDRGQYKVANITLTADKLREKIKLIQAKGTLSKTARRKLAAYKKKLAIETDTDVTILQPTLKDNKKQQMQAKKKNEGQTKKIDNDCTVVAVKTEPGSMIRIQANQSGKNKNETSAARKGKKEEADKKKMKVEANAKEVDDDEDDDDDDDDDDDIDEIDLEGEDDDDSEDEDDNDDSDEEEDDDDSEADDSLKTNESVSPAKKTPEKKEKNAGKPDAKKKRYVLFVGNIPFDSTVDEIKTHFLTKVSAVESVRLPQKQGSNQSRGIAYVELTNDIDFEKALSLHHSFLKGRRINVQYTAGGSNPAGHKAEIVAKNKKLHALRHAGKLAGSSQRGGGARRFTPMGGRSHQRTTKT